MIAVLADIHGNLPALDAVLADLPAISGVWVLGDTIGELPWPCQVLDRLFELARRLPVTFVAGNRELSLMEARDGRHPDWWLGRQMRPLAWTADCLRPHHWETLRAWPISLALEDAPGGALLFHGSPRDVRGLIRTRESAEDVTRGSRQRWLAGGHSHLTRLYLIGEQALISAGSVGIPLEGVGGVAAYALIDEARMPGACGSVAFRQVAYDVEAAIASLQRSELAELAPGITRAVTLELRTGIHHMLSLVAFCNAHAERALGRNPGNIPIDLWREAEPLWNGAPWRGYSPK